MKFKIREIGSDNEWLQTCELLQTVYVGDGYTTALIASEFMVRERFEGQSETLVAVDEHGQVQGVVLFLLKDSVLRQVAEKGEREFRMLGVAASARGHGVGQALVKACIDRAQEAGASALVLWTQPKRPLLRSSIDSQPSLVRVSMFWERRSRCHSREIQTALRKNRN